MRRDGPTGREVLRREASVRRLRRDRRQHPRVVARFARAGRRAGLLAGDPQDLPEDFQQLLHVEATLLAVRQLETLVVPGLLQTPDYTRALVNGGAVWPARQAGRLRTERTRHHAGAARDDRRDSRGAGRFSILTLPEPIPDFGYAESPGGAMYIEDRTHVRELVEQRSILTDRALSPAQSLDVIRAAEETAG
jgi:uncharacterized protein DUF5753